MSEQKRRHYRIKYREGDRPKLTLAGTDYIVLDLSEQGLRFDAGPRFKPLENMPIAGKVTFTSGKHCPIEGTVLRYDGVNHACILQLQKDIPLAVIMEEQRMILKKYPTLE